LILDRDRAFQSWLRQMKANVELWSAPARGENHLWGWRKSGNFCRGRVAEKIDQSVNQVTCGLADMAEGWRLSLEQRRWVDRLVARPFSLSTIRHARKKFVISMVSAFGY
jgi:hypothetical protein